MTRVDADHHLRRPAPAAGADRESLASHRHEPAARRASRRSPLDLGQPGATSFLYSNRSYWYPQATVTDYATASSGSPCRSTFECVASGDLDAGFPNVADRQGRRAARQKAYLFTTSHPVAVSRVHRQPVRASDRLDVHLPTWRSHRTSGSRPARRPIRCQIHRASRPTLAQTRPRRAGAQRAGDIMRFYAVADRRRALSELHARVGREHAARRPQPGILRQLNQPLPNTPYVAERSGVVRGLPEFFMAHEIAHQWWGQAVGWRNYHEQWLSEGFSQYFAALYAQRLARRRHVRRRAAPDAPLGDQRVGPGTVYLGLPPRPHPRRRPRLSRRSSTTRARWSCTCCVGWSATRRSSAGCSASTPSRGSARPAPRTSGAAMEAETATVARTFLRALDLRPDTAAIAVQLLASKARPPDRGDLMSNRRASVFDLPLSR